MSKQDWTIIPESGLGHLTFGMSPADVDDLQSAYGTILSERRMEMPQSIIDETLAMFGDSVSEEDKQVFLDGIKQSYQGNLVQVRSGMGSVLVLEFDAVGLNSIQISDGGEVVNFAGTRLFQSTSEDVLKAFQTANGVPGRYRNTLAAFDELSVELDKFSEISSTGQLRILGKSDESFAERTVMLRKAPYLPENEKDTYTHLHLK